MKPLCINTTSVQLHRRFPFTEFTELLELLLASVQRGQVSPNDNAKVNR